MRPRKLAGLVLLLCAVAFILPAPMLLAGPTYSPLVDGWVVEPYLWALGVAHGTGEAFFDPDGGVILKIQDTTGREWATSAITQGKLPHKWGGSYPVFPKESYPDYVIMYYGEDPEGDDREPTMEGGNWDAWPVSEPIYLRAD